MKESLKELLKRLTNLLAVKSVVTLMLVGVFAYLVVRCLPIPQELNQIVLMVVSFYFGTQITKDK